MVEGIGDIMLRSLGAIFMLFVITRVLGKKQISQLSLFEYVTGITLGELAGFLSTDIEAHYLHGVAALSLWFFIPLTLEYTTLKSKRLRHLFEGKGTVVIRQGKILEDNLRRERYTADELLEQLRAKSVFKVADVEFAMLEASGELSILLKKDKQPLTVEDVGIISGPDSLPHTVIMDGQINDEELAASSLSREWLHKELVKLNATVDNIFLAQVGDSNKLYVDFYDDGKGHKKEKPQAELLATLRKCTADMDSLARSSGTIEARVNYEQTAAALREAVQKLSGKAYK
ncbi:DUF421 domain-containing protein [Paenibacillus sp. FJAT-26967]|uniref:DUF421 domain-containing protein n=1 Tax=Paenibacillus sp. FJAT-26967 TaxID=1729690 RepID=UPI000AD01416|nr:DUF421 domain-containing protein [Paenibacillus sp. FJAT-26967]